MDNVLLEELIISGVAVFAVLLVAHLSLRHSIAQLRCALAYETKNRRAEYNLANERGWETSRRLDRLVKALGYEEVDQPCKVLRRAA